MHKHNPLKLPANWHEFVERATAEADGCVSAGGLAYKPGMLERPEVSAAPTPESRFDTLRVALARYIEFSRRNRGMTVEAFATRSGVDITEIIQLEDGDAPAPEPRVVFAIAGYLKADPAKLMELAGHVKLRDAKLGQEAVRFAAWSQCSQPLSKQEEEFLQAFARVVVESSERSR